jgi:DinB superfamily
MPANSLDSRLLLQVIDSGYDRKAWHGPNLKQSLRGVTARDAAWRPAPGRHNIWEITVHAAYWKYVARRKLTGAPRGSFALKGSNWFKRPLASTELAWKEDRKLLEREHRKLREIVAALGPAGVREIPWSVLYGVAFHDVYHAGQIRLLRRLRTRA